MPDKSSIPLRVIAFSDAYEHEVMALLDAQQETSLFLLSNKSDFGTQANQEAAKSGDWKVIIDQNNDLHAVFYISQQGIILLQSDRAYEISDLVFMDCLNSGIKPRGVVGDWSLAEPVWSLMLKNLRGFTPSFTSKEILYSLQLPAELSGKNNQIRFLNTQDLSQWEELNAAYCKETGLKPEGTEIRRQSFQDKVARKFWWGYFQDELLISIAGYNAFAAPLAQIGGVFTRSEYRRRGLAEQVISQLIIDSRNLHQLKKLMLFTQDDNTAAQKLYNKIGFNQIGEFALLFGNYSPDKK